eukprot:CAMPEP_0185554928 /NCGR_PEP_ID=MMETSP1381-20130426/42918_1 /TAXON_ID=298111 /ORGANISM="Pavlova sp., Strain CCMP459" /LENGTH=57 /DNA_ID=CAMNT_0028168187 /DNA_START=169 /DNA_END=342 /DNA_ORIENTATION=+
MGTSNLAPRCISFKLEVVCRYARGDVQVVFGAHGAPVDADVHAKSHQSFHFIHGPVK